jgi:hypothetical protein
VKAATPRFGRRSRAWSHVAVRVVLAATAASSIGACRAQSAGPEESSPGPGCVVTATFVDGGPETLISGSGFEPDQPASLTLDDGRNQTTYTQTTNPALRTDVRGAVFFRVAAERENIGVTRIELTAGDCTATTASDVTASMFPPACPHTEPVASGGADAEAYTAMVLADKPIAYWQFEEHSGPFAVATVGQNAAIQGDGVRAQQGPIPGSRAIGFDGEGDWVGVVPLELDDDFTIEGWVFFCENLIDNADALVGLAGEGPDINFFDARLRLWDGNGDPAVADTPVAPDRWYHVAVVRRDDELTLYLDGRLVGAGQFDQPFRVSALGSGNAGSLTGQLDEVAIYDHALTPEQLAARFAAAS